jgi:poly-gamma-glutamate synthesis protein (capsule biosynthesis protein)
MKIALLGDIALFGKFSLNNTAIHAYLSELASELKDYDYVIGNLETPLTDNVRPAGAKSAHIKASSNNITLLKFLSISHINLANNHIFDYGLDGYLSTLALLEKNEIGIFGVDGRQCFLEGITGKIALSGYCCYSTHGSEYLTEGKKHGINILNGFDVEKDLLTNADKGYFNICSVHCGQEHVNKPNHDHIRMARKLADAVPYLFYGHHPHVLQGIEIYKDSLLAYSLGNLCFDDVYTSKSKTPLIKQSENNRSSIILALTVEGNKIKDYYPIPLFDDGERISINAHPEICYRLKQYSEFLKLPLNEYVTRRSAEITKYIQDRKKNRDLNWYLKRLNFSSVRMIINARRNAKLYNNAVTAYLNNGTQNSK